MTLSAAGLEKTGTLSGVTCRPEGMLESIKIVLELWQKETYPVGKACLKSSRLERNIKRGRCTSASRWRSRTGDETSRSNFDYIHHTNRFHPARRQPITGPSFQSAVQISVVPAAPRISASLPPPNRSARRRLCDWPSRVTSSLALSLRSRRANVNA